MRAFLIKAAPVATALGLIGCVANAGPPGENEGPLRCEIAATSSGKTIALEGLVEADSAVSGTYLFRVVGSGRGGSSNIQQGGAFAAGPDGTATLGRIMLGASSGAVYDATLTIETNGETIECSERIGGV